MVIDEERSFIRHRTDIPILWRTEQYTAPDKEYLKDISFGGLAFVSHSGVQVGMAIEIDLPIEEPAVTVKGHVVWCKSCLDGFYEVGVRFVNVDEHFRMRMVEQVCRIEHFRSEVYQNEDRTLSSEEAASEWIQKHAQRFPN